MSSVKKVFSLPFYRRFEKDILCSNKVGCEETSGSVKKARFARLMCLLPDMLVDPEDGSMISMDLTTIVVHGSMIPVDLARKIGHESMILLDPTIKSDHGSMISADLSIKKTHGSMIQCDLTT